MTAGLNYIYYGTRCNSGELEDFLLHVLQTNQSAQESGRKMSPICIWGNHGIGKTEIVETLAKEQNYKFRYIAPAQFEEMGDLVGMPMIKGAKENSEEASGSTVFVAPEWVPKEEGPGILLIDDVNRADDRILRGIMQLLQNFELVSWKLPPGWQIILTANPDGGDYSVTPMDFAMLTRMMHVTLEFDVQRWSLWADRNKIDPRGINFVLTYPETVTGERTTPRTLVQFFESISHMEDLKANLGLVKMLADSCLDEPTVASFVTFINHRLAKLISPTEILKAVDFRKEVYEPIHEIVVGETTRVDILSVISTRLMNSLSLAQQEFSPEEIENVVQFFLMDFIPGDLRLTIARSLSVATNPKLKAIVARPEIGRIILQQL